MPPKYQLTHEHQRLLAQARNQVIRHEHAKDEVKRQRQELVRLAYLCRLEGIPWTVMSQWFGMPEETIRRHLAPDFPKEKR